MPHHQPRRRISHPSSRVRDTLLRFELEVALPPSWLAVYQGAGAKIEDTGRGVRIGWRESQPEDEMAFSAARFKLYRKATPFGEAQAYLRLPDDALAARYLDATGDYLDLYSELIGRYPFGKFALVENFWETGYGMPSFTLLGQRVCAFPSSWVPHTHTRSCTTGGVTASSSNTRRQLERRPDRLPSRPPVQRAT